MEISDDNWEGPSNSLNPFEFDNIWVFFLCILPSTDLLILLLTALFNNMRTLTFKSQPTNAFFATANQMFGGSSQLPTVLS